MSISFDPLLTSSGSNTSSSSDENVSSSLETGEFCLFTFISTLDESRASLTPPRTASHNSPTTSCSCYYENILTLLNDSDMKTDIDLFLNENHTQPNSRSRGDEGEEAHSHVDPKTNFNLSDEEDRTRCKVRHGSSDDETSIRRCIERKGHALLLRSLEKGVLFPVIHWSTKADEILTHSIQYVPTLRTNQGIYKEIKRVIPPEVWLHGNSEPSTSFPSSSFSGSMNSVTSSTNLKSTTWLMIGYKSLEKTLDSCLEATWKDWTGIRHIYLHLRTDFEIRRISFLHRVHPVDNLDLFMYVVLMEIGNVNYRNRIWLLDFVQRMRVERMKGFLTVYAQEEPRISLIEEEYRKYVSKDSTFSEPHLIPSETPPPVTMEKVPTNALDYHTSVINGNIMFMEKLLEEIRQDPIGDYF